MKQVSKRLRLEVLLRRMAGERQYEIARAIGEQPATISTLLRNIAPVRDDDPRVLALGRLLGIPDEECFEPVDTRAES